MSEPPKHGEIEVSVFGPGYGESVLVHLGQQEWMIIDSCINLSSRQPAPLEYLRNIKADPATAVKLVVATHWHDDHVRGLGAVFRECTSAQFVCSTALRFQEFLTFVQASGTRSMMTSSGVQEFSEILDLLERRASSSRPESVSPTWAIADRLLWQRAASAGFPCEVHALSPSDAATALAYRETSRLLPRQGTQKRRVVAQAPNHVAVVLWIRIGDATILLGSDLEETLHPRTGWTVIVDSSTRPSGTANVFKIPHHGSVTADQPRVWSEMLQAEPVAVLTPFIQGSVRLPTEADIGRICSRTTRGYSTSVVKPGRSRKRSGAVERTIRETVRSIREAQGPIGHVQLRKNVLDPANSDWNVELFGAVLPLRELT